jgi:hypothetical protein
MNVRIITPLGVAPPAAAADNPADDAQVMEEELPEANVVAPWRTPSGRTITDPMPTIDHSLHITSDVSE